MTVENPATNRNGDKLIVHKRLEVLPKSVVVTRQRLDGGYMAGSRIYIGVHKEQEAFIVSVPDCGEGTAFFQEWMEENHIRAERFLSQ
jgi:hypothetical protein